MISSAHLVAVKCEVFTTTSTREIQLCARPATRLRRSLLLPEYREDFSERGLLWLFERIDTIFNWAMSKTNNNQLNMRDRGGQKKGTKERKRKKVWGWGWRGVAGESRKKEKRGGGGLKSSSLQPFSPVYRHQSTSLKKKKEKKENSDADFTFTACFAHTKTGSN